ncbi:hypothetical protein B0T17DRAFT_511544 [Bombardia bombarda]|uniref:Uncharacterized protein n=1 Tax=Bombardia bombarda TaxID=252184 RepID=A0AA39WAP1_9PEZI|nr:hypothetical protein B0T17DRAFT_511544 [Bombardia bombarda]
MYNITATKTGALVTHTSPQIVVKTRPPRLVDARLNAVTHHIHLKRKPNRLPTIINTNKHGFWPEHHYHFTPGSLPGGAAPTKHNSNQGVLPRAITQSYGHILDLNIPEDLAVPNPDQMLDEEKLRITKPDDILNLISWNDKIIRPTLNFAKEHLNIRNGILLQYTATAPNNSEKARIRGVQDRMKIDHIIEFDDYPVKNLVVGLGIPCSRELGNTCESVHTRYGYLLTEEDLVVCCFSAVAQGSRDWNVATMPVPWSRHGENQLTTDLALWWLCMLAMSPHQSHEVVPEMQMTGINKWQAVYKTVEGVLVYRHRYSRREKPALLPILNLGQLAAAAAAAAAATGDASQLGMGHFEINGGDLVFASDFNFTSNGNFVLDSNA